MRINYKFLFNYLDDRLDASQTHELMISLKEEPRVREMLDRLTHVLKNPMFQQPHGKEAEWPNANLVSTYLEGTLKGDDLKTFISATLGREVNTTGDLTKRDASRVIDALKQSEPK